MTRLKWSATGIVIATAVTIGVVKTNEQPVSAQATQGAAGVITAESCQVVLKDSAILAAERPGILDKIEAREGDFVRANSEVAWLRSGEASAVLKTAELTASNDVQIRYATKSSEVADQALNMAIDANSKGVIAVPKAEIMKLTLESQKGILSIENSKHDMAVSQQKVVEANETLKTYTVRTSNFDAVVAKVFRKEGEAVRQGDPILEVISMRKVKVEAYISISESYTVKAGDEVSVKLDMTRYKGIPPHDWLPGTITFVDPRVSDAIRKVRIVAEVENLGLILKHGLKAVMKITPGKSAKTARLNRTRRN